MSKEIKLGRLARDASAAQIEIRRADDGKRVTLSFPASSEAPVDRSFGTEVLSHDPQAVNTARLQAGAMPLLFNHDWGDPIGMLSGGRIKDGRLWVDATMFTTERAAEVALMVEQGLRNVSVSYEIEELTEDTKRRGVFTATRWQPLEVSIVTVPADASVGIGRQADDELKPVRMVRAVEVSQPVATATSLKGIAMSEQQNAATGANVEVRAAQPSVVITEDHAPRKSPVEVERERREAIINMSKASNIDSRTEQRWIVDGTPLTKVAADILDVIEERGKTKPQSAAELGLSRGDQQRYSMFRVMRMLSARNPSESQSLSAEAAYEIECSRAVAKSLGREPDGIFVPADILRRPVASASRAMLAQPGASGGYLVDTDNMGFIDMLRNRSVLSSLGARTLSGLQGNVAIPRQTAAGTLVWQAGETTAATAADQTLGQFSMTPKTAIAVTEVGRTLMMQSSPSAEAMVTADLAKVVALGVDLAGLTGTGGAQPLGIENTTGVTTGQDAANATYAKMLAFQGVAAAANAMLDGAGYVTTPAVAAILMAKSRFANTDTPLWDGSINDGQMCGVRAMSSNQVASGHCIFGSWSEVLIGEWGVLELTMNPYQSFNAGVVGIRAIYTVDVLVRYPAAFVVSSSVTA